MLKNNVVSRKTCKKSIFLGCNSPRRASMRFVHNFAVIAIPRMLHTALRRLTGPIKESGEVIFMGNPRRTTACCLRRHRGRAGRKGSCANGRAPARRRTLNYSNNSKSISSFIPPQQLRRFFMHAPIQQHRAAPTRIPAETDFHCRIRLK